MGVLREETVSLGRIRRRLRWSEAKLDEPASPALSRLSNIRSQLFP